MTTILEVLEKGAQFLSQKGLKDARLNMELLVAHELGLKRMDLYLRFDQPIPEESLSKLRENLKKRGQRIPIQHIIGFTEFYRDTFKTDGRALIPRPETEELVELIHKANFSKPARILDLGCGSGALGISVSRALGPDCEQLILADLSTEALSLARENSERLEVQCELVESDLFSAITGTFDIIAANLPYVAESARDDLEPELKYDPELALFSGADGLDCLRRFAKDCPPFLNSGGLIALEVGFDQGDLVAQLLKEAGLVDVTVALDLNGIARFPLARKA